MFEVQPPAHHSHMPFAFWRDGHMQTVFSQSLPRHRLRRGKLVAARPSAWKLQWCMPFVPAVGKIDTRLGESEDECSPTVSEHQGEVQVSFVGTLAKERPQGKTLDGAAHRLFVMKEPSIDRLGPAHGSIFGEGLDSRV